MGDFEFAVQMSQEASLQVRLQKRPASGAHPLSSAFFDVRRFARFYKRPRLWPFALSSVFFDTIGIMEFQPETRSFRLELEERWLLECEALTYPDYELEHLLDRALERGRAGTSLPEALILRDLVDELSAAYEQHRSMHEPPARREACETYRRPVVSWLSKINAGNHNKEIRRHAVLSPGTHKCGVSHGA